MPTGKEKLDAPQLWRAVLAKMKLTFSDLVYKTCLANTQAQNLTDTSIEIICASAYTKDQLLRSCHTLVQKSVNEVGKGDYNIIYKIGKIKNKVKEEPIKAPLFEQEDPPPKKVLRACGLSPNYTFKNYVTGDNNQLAYSIAWSIATTPGINYNPLFLYSGVGLGKTHLIQAIGNKILKEKPNLKVIYTTGESFTNELVETIRKSKSKKGDVPTKFRNKFRKVDVFLIDDIQFIVGKAATQQELFHTFNDLHMDEKQIVITSDRPPKEFKTLDRRLTSRFGSGVCVDIQAPDFELRTAILRNKRDKNKDIVSNEVIDLIAQKVDTNIRELEGAYLQVVSYAKALGKKITKETTLEILGQTIAVEPTKPINLNQILKAICKYYNVTGKELKGKRRTKNIVIPRQVAMYLLRDITGTPYMTIGDFLGGRDHSTILYGFEKIEEEIKVGTKIKRDVANVKQIIYQSA